MIPRHMARSGFSLIEVIATLVVLGVLAAAMMPFLGQTMTRSSQPALCLEAALDLGAVMANIVADYSASFRGDLEGLRAKIGDPAASGYGEYQVAPGGNGFVKFVGGTATDIDGDPSDPEYGMYLKVTIQSAVAGHEGETLTHLFTRQE